MSSSNFDQLDRPRFTWPEPLVIEIIYDHGPAQLGHDHRREVAKRHAALLRVLIESGETNDPAARTSLLATYAGCGLGADVVAVAEQAVFLELMRLVGSRFRNSTRLRDDYTQRLERLLADMSAGPAQRSARALAKPANKTAIPKFTRWRTAVAV